MRYTKTGISLLLLFLGQVSVQAQGLVQNGGNIVISEGAYLMLDGVNAHYYDTLNGHITITDNGFIKLPGNWTNVSGDEIFTNNNGEVELYGAVQRIRGDHRTSFPTMELSGSDDKWLDISVLVGGGFVGGGAGVLNCTDRLLYLNGHRIEVNNSSNAAIQETGGGIVSESDASTGYGFVQWNVRSSSGLYQIPFITPSRQAVPYIFDIKTSGVSTTDSGFVEVATYPTDASQMPNNRMMPSLVTNTNNEYGRENADRMVDRYWVINADLYSTKPAAEASYSYLDAEWQTGGGSTNDLTESNLKPIVFAPNVGEWFYPGRGVADAARNRSTGEQGDLSGVWVLVDTTICPNALFTWDGNCQFSPIQFTDNSTISKGSIETWAWNFGNVGSSDLQNPETVYTVAGVFDAQLIVTGSSGCPDTLNLPLNIDAKAIADFEFDDDPLVDFPVLFTETSQNDDSWDWDFGDFNYASGASVSHTYGSEAVYTVQLIANNAADCPDTVVKDLEVNLPSLFLVPSAFSPGSKDDLNRDIGLTTLQRVSEYHFMVFNRWGEKIFESNRIEDRWDGTYLNSPVASGSYLYMITFRDRKQRGHALNGTFLLVR